MRQPREIEIPMPWGRMSAQEWGNVHSRRKILAIHGWMDNSNSFQKLIPMLPPDVYVIAIDLCGHGFSSHRPPGCAYTLLEFCIDVKRATEFLDWHEFAIIAHSMGAMVSYLFVGLFPDLVTHLVCLDAFSIIALSRQSLPESTASVIQSLLGFEKKHGDPPVYSSFEEIVDRRFRSTPHSLMRESAHIIMGRATKECKGGIVLRTDPRLKYFRTQGYSYEDQLEIIKRYKGHLLVIRCVGTSNERFSRVPVDAFFSTFKKNCSEFHLNLVEGSHTVHLDEPEKVSDTINAFLASYVGTKGIHGSKL